MSELSTKPYLIRAIYEWCVDSGFTPHLAVEVDESTRVPMAYVKDGSIVLNISTDAVKTLHMGNSEITCGARFGGVPFELYVPVSAIVGIFAKETGQGLVFQAGEGMPPLGMDGEGDDEPPPQPPSGRPSLRVVK